LRIRTHRIAVAIDISQAPVAFLGTVASFLVAFLAVDPALRFTADVAAACCATRFAVLLSAVSRLAE